MLQRFWTGVNGTTRLGTALAPEGRVDRNGRWRLAIRAVVVTTRSSVRSHRTWGKHDLEHEATERGMELLDELGTRLPDDPELREEHAAARRTLEAMLNESAQPADPPRSVSAPEAESEESEVSSG
jgi:hypothetical protein